MKPFQIRVLDEKRQLDEKILKLSCFTDTAQFTQLREEDRELLHTQLLIMRGYSGVLEARIDNFKLC